ncbi:CopG family ribbon-helix-helix protein [Thermogladius sp. KZ2Tp1]|uniref:CopG family ribbon-helix-helix protein n=1 Tax=Thermogladius sp. KZ2Tp1 TaxID=3136289 RepID=UPI003DAA1182
MPRGVVFTALKIGVYLPEDIAEKLIKVRDEKGLSLSRIVQLALYNYLAEEEFLRSDNVTAVIGLLYDHGMDRADVELTDIQHHYLGLVISATHIHLDERNCLLAIFVRGKGGEVAKLFEELRKVKGVKSAKLMTLLA